MKKINVILLVCLSLGLSITHLQASKPVTTGFLDRLESQAQCFKKMTTKPEIGPGFSFINKFNKPVTITLTNEGLPQPGGLLNRFKTPSLTQIVPTGHILDAKINIDLPKPTTELKVEYIDSTNKKIVHKYGFPSGKTIYVTFAQKPKTPAPLLYPQTGPLGGALQATEQCYALQHNVNQADISKR
jgi:hypothetical protein